MFTKSQLEAMKFNELRRLAREMNISRRWTCKREAIDHLMSTGQDENLDAITVTFVDSPDSTRSSCGSQVVSFPQQSTAEAIRTTKRSAQSRFPKPRMTVFQQDEGDSPVLKAESSHKPQSRFPKPRMTVFQQDGDSPVLKAGSSYEKSQKYFATPSMLRKSKASESFSCSIPKHAPEAVSSRKKKSLIHDFASNGAMTFSGVTFREHGRPITRSYKDRFPSIDLSESSGEHYSDIEESSPKNNLNETFEIKNETIKADISIPLEANIKEQDVQPDKLNNSTREKGITASPLRVQGHSKTSTPKDDTDDKENEISDSESMNATSELPCPSKERFCASNMENNKNGRRKRSSSCPRERKGKEGHSKAVFFSPTAKLVAPPESQLHHKRGTQLKGTKIPIFVNKMPDFANIHKKEFEKMESVVDCHQRKLQRAKTLFSPKAAQDVQPVMVFSAQSSAAKQIPSRNPMTLTERNELPINQVIRDMPQKAVAERNILQHPRPNKGRLIQHNDVKQMVTNKLPLKKIRGVREESRTVIRGVRLNRRFELQMAHRKLN